MLVSCHDKYTLRLVCFLEMPVSCHHMLPSWRVVLPSQVHAVKNDGTMPVTCSSHTSSVSYSIPRSHEKSTKATPRNDATRQRDKSNKQKKRTRADKKETNEKQVCRRLCIVRTCITYIYTRYQGIEYSPNSPASYPVPDPCSPRRVEALTDGLLPFLVFIISISTLPSERIPRSTDCTRRV